MKTILLIVALTGFSIAGGYAQNKSCCCKKTAAIHHKIVHHKLAAKTVTRTYQPRIEVVEEPCYTYRQHNIVVTECPNTFYDNDDNFGFIQEGNYSGYYPVTTTSTNESTATESTTPMNNSLAVSSSAFGNYGVIPTKYTCEGDHASPPLNIGNIPAGTKSLALVMYDAEATIPVKSASEHKENMTYWMVWNIDTTSYIPENYISDNQSINASKSWGYEAICPAAGTHYYHFMVYALDTKLRLGKNSTKSMLERAVKGHVLSEGELVGAYNRHLEK